MEDKNNLIIKKNPVGNPNWKKGMISPNPVGGGIGAKKLAYLFTSAFLRDETNSQDNLFEYAFKRARKNDTVLITLLNKFVPDLLKGEGFDRDTYTQIFTKLSLGDLQRIADTRNGSTIDDTTGSAKGTSQ